MRILIMMTGGKQEMQEQLCINIKPAMLVVGGLFDAEDCCGAWNLYKAIEKQNPDK